MTAQWQRRGLAQLYGAPDTRSTRERRRDAGLPSPRDQQRAREEILRAGERAQRNLFNITFDAEGVFSETLANLERRIASALGGAALDSFRQMPDAHAIRAMGSPRWVDICAGDPDILRVKAERTSLGVTFLINDRSLAPNEVVLLPETLKGWVYRVQRHLMERFSGSTARVTFRVNRYGDFLTGSAHDQEFYDAPSPLAGTQIRSPRKVQRSLAGAWVSYVVNYDGRVSVVALSHGPQLPVTISKRTHHGTFRKSPSRRRAEEANSSSLRVLKARSGIIGILGADFAASGSDRSVYFVWP